MTEILFEAYRPKSFEEVIGNEAVIEEIKATVASGEIPHYLFYGPPGVGKTTTARIIHSVLDEMGLCSSYMSINASDERKIEVVREKIKGFVRTGTGDNRFKILFLDEMDSMPELPQEALRTLMEDYSDNCRFIISCNQIYKIIPAIQSRCASYGFRPIERETAINRLRYIVEQEEGEVADEYIQQVYSKSNGDMRMSINLLQAAINGQMRNLDEVFHTDIYDGIIESIASGNARQPMVDIDKLLEEGVDAKEILFGIYNSVKSNHSLENYELLYKKMGELNLALSNGVIPKIQFSWFVNECTEE